MDTIADMLTIIRNAQAVKKQTANVPFSKLKFEIARIFKEEGLIEGFEKKGKKTKKSIQINLKYDSSNTPAISDIKRISKPGQRVYVTKNQNKTVRQGFGMAIISTSRGLMTNKEAKKKGLGGEVICEVY